MVGHDNTSNMHKLRKCVAQVCSATLGHAMPSHATICVYMCLCLTHESYRDVFSAGASHYGVADLELLAQETHKFESRYLDQLIGPYPADKQTYVERSPIHALDKFTAPTAFFQVRFPTLVIVLAVHML